MTQPEAMYKKPYFKYSDIGKLKIKEWKDYSIKIIV